MKRHSVNSLLTHEMKAFVKECDQQLEARIEAAISALGDLSQLRLFGLTGPTCSGKTTAARKITEYMEARGLRVHVISVDDFYYDLNELKERTRQKGSDEIDYDSEDTIDISLLREQTERLLSCKKTALPHFDFHTGRREFGEEIQPQKEDVFLFEGIQILYPKVRQLLQKTEAYRSLAICPLSEIAVGGEVFTPNEIRFYRRVVRDFHHRSASPQFTFYIWQSVRKNEEANIFPHMHLCNAFIDATMPYEMGMLRPYLEPLLESIPRDSEYAFSAKEILKRFHAIQPIPSAYLTPKSLYKEFI